MANDIKAQVAELKQFAKAHPEMRIQVQLVLTTLNAVKKHPRSAPLMELLRAQLEILETKMRSG